MLRLIYILLRGLININIIFKFFKKNNKVFRFKVIFRNSRV